MFGIIPRFRDEFPRVCYVAKITVLSYLLQMNMNAPETNNPHFTSV